MASCCLFRFVLVALVCVHAPVAAQTSPVVARTATLDSVLTTRHADGLFDGVVLIGAQGEPVYQRALGNLAGAPMTIETAFPLASVEKAITATAVLSLVEEERVDLDGPVGR